jgi:hypothetical protein
MGKGEVNSSDVYNMECWRRELLASNAELDEEGASAISRIAPPPLGRLLAPHLSVRSAAPSPERRRSLFIFLRETS